MLSCFDLYYAEDYTIASDRRYDYLQKSFLRRIHIICTQLEGEGKFDLGDFADGCVDV